MTYTGYMELRQDHRKPSLPALLDHLDHGRAALGLKIDWPEIDQARAYRNRANELRAAYREHAATGREQVAAAGLDYNAGNLTAAELIDQATTAATLEGDAGRVAGQMLEAAALRIEAEGAPLLHNITEARWLKVLRPAVTKALAAAQSVADELGITEARPQVAGVLTHANPWAPTEGDLRADMNLRHKWERLGAALAELDAVHAYADDLRTWGLLPLVPGRTFREDYRWLHTDRLAGTLDDARVFFLANRAHAEPGIYTTAEMVQAAPPNVREHGIDRYTAATLAADPILDAAG